MTSTGSPPPCDLDANLFDLSINDPQATAFTDLTLIGWVVASKSVPFNAIKAILLNSWNFGAPLKLSHLDRNLFATSFANTKDRDKVLSACPWSIKGYLVILQTWTTGFSLEELEFRYSPFWVQVHNLPLNRMNKDNATCFGNYIGSFLTVDRRLAEHKVSGFLRLKVSVDVSKPLKTNGFTRNDDGTSRWLAFKYERISDFCFCCGKLGHCLSTCSSPGHPSYGVSDPRVAFGAWMRSSTVNKWDPISGSPPDPSGSPHCSPESESLLRTDIFPAPPLTVILAVYPHLPNPKNFPSIIFRGCHLPRSLTFHTYYGIPHLVFVILTCFLLHLTRSTISSYPFHQWTHSLLHITLLTYPFLQQ